MEKQTKISTFFRKRRREEESSSSNEHSSELMEVSVTEANESEDNACDSEADDSMTADTQTASKKKKSHVFNESWKQHRPWLFLNEKNEMKCKWCIDTGKNNSFTTGNKNYRTSTLERHVDLPAHKQAILDLKHSSDFKMSSLNALHKKQDALERAMSVVYWLAKENIASLKYGSMLEFLEFQGVKLDSMNVGNNATYSSRTSVDEFQVSFS